MVKEKEINLELVEREEESTDEMFLTGFEFDHSLDIEPNYNFYNELN